MKTIILATSDAEGRGALKVLATPDVDAQEQNKIMDAADRHEFPKGVQWIGQFQVGDQPVRQEAFVSDEVAELKQKAHARVLREHNKRVAENDDARARAENIRFANKTFNDHARQRNDALAAVAAQRNLLAANLSAADKEKAHEKIKELEPKAKAAQDVFNVVLAARNVVLNPKSAPEAVADALEILKSPEGKEAPAAPSENEFNRDDLNAMENGDLLKLATGLVESGRLEALPKKTSKGELIKTILSARPLAPATGGNQLNV